MIPKYKASSVVPYTPTHPTFGQSIKDGVGLGIGSGLGHALIGRMFGGLGSPTEVHPVKEACKVERRAFESCIMTNPDICQSEQSSLTHCLHSSKKDLE
jgi:hypothetical protein